MGKQVLLHMLQPDKESFFENLETRHAFNATVWASSQPEVVMEKAPAQEERMLALWPSGESQKKERVKVSREDGSEVFELDRNTPILEWTPSKIVEHESRPALLQGRLYLFATAGDAEVLRLLRSATQWVKNSFEPCPAKSFGGYVGPSAMQWFRDGGLLLPMFNPPSTAHWEQLLNEQHSTHLR